MNGDKIPDVTIIGSCENNLKNYNFPLVFFRENNKFVYYKKVENLFGFIGLTVDDVRAYIKSPEKNYKYLRDRYDEDDLEILE